MSLQINKRQFKKWIKALDSGEYHQGYCELQNSGGYCCLGVGCAVTIPKQLLSLDPTGFIDGGMPEDQPAAPKWLVELSPDFFTKTGAHLLDLNDSCDYTFPEIATLLELVYIHKILD
jgi:hypothetical protein